MTIGKFIALYVMGMLLLAVTMYGFNISLFAMFIPIGMAVAGLVGFLIHEGHINFGTKDINHGNTDN